MENIFVRSVKEEVISFIDRKANELSKISGRKITRNYYINLILEHQLRDDLSVNDDKIGHMNAKLDELIKLMMEYADSNNRLIGLIVHGDDIEEEFDV